MSSESVPVGAAIDRRLAAFRCPDDPSGRLTIDVRFGQPAVPAALNRARPVYDRPGAPVRYDEPGDQLLLVEPGQATMLIRAAEGHARVWLAADSPGTAWLVSHGMTTIMLIECLKRLDRFVVHAAAVSRHGRAVVLPASSGGGKTTLSLVLTHGGWAFMSDDLVLLEPNGTNAVEVLGFPDEIDLCADTFSLLPWLGVAASPPPAGYPKFPLEISRAVPGADVSRRATAAAIVLPTITRRARSELRSADPGQALLCMLPSVLLTEPRSSQRQFDVMGRLCETARCFQLGAGTDLAELPDLVAGAV